VPAPGLAAWVAAAERQVQDMRPAAVEITELAKTTTGKIQKAELRNKEWAGHNRRIG